MKAARLAEALGCEACAIVGKSTWSDEELGGLQEHAGIPVVVCSLAAFLMLF
jgi:hypothetical protein